MIGWIFEDILYEVICFWVGFVFLKVVTAGRFPNREQEERYKERIKCLGAVLIVVVLAFIGFLLV